MRCPLSSCRNGTAVIPLWCGSSSAGTKPCRRTSGRCRRSRAGARPASSSSGAPAAHPQTPPSQLRSHLPELGKETLAEGRLQVVGPAAAARSWFAADLPLDHEDMPRAPEREGLVMIEQRLAQVEEVSVTLAIQINVAQRRRAPALDEGSERIGERRFFQALAQAIHLIGRRLDAGEVCGVLHT